MSNFEKIIITTVVVVCSLVFIDRYTEFGTRIWQKVTMQNQLHPIYEKNKYGFINSRGRIDIKPQFLNLSEGTFDGDLFPVKHVDYGAWGYINRDGKWEITPRYAWAKHFSEGYAAVAFENPISYSYGFINKSGQVVVEPRFNSARGFHEGLAGVQLGARWGFINEFGEFIVAPNYEAVKDFSHNLVPVQKNGKWGVITNLSDQVADFIYDDIGMYKMYLAPARKGGVWGYLDNVGDEVIPFKYVFASEFSEGLAVVKDAEGWKYIDRHGKVKISVKNAIDARDFSEGFAAVKILPPEEDVKSLAKWGYINKKGEMIIQPTFDVALDFHGGLASVGLDRNLTYRGYIDAKGEFVWKPLNLKVFGKREAPLGLYIVIAGLILYGFALIRLFLRREVEGYEERLLSEDLSKNLITDKDVLEEVQSYINNEDGDKGDDAPIQFASVKRSPTAYRPQKPPVEIKPSAQEVVQKADKKEFAPIQFAKQKRSKTDKGEQTQESKPIQFAQQKSVKAKDVTKSSKDIQKTSFSNERDPEAKSLFAKLKERWSNQNSSDYVASQAARLSSQDLERFNSKKEDLEEYFKPIQLAKTPENKE